MTRPRKSTRTRAPAALDPQETPALAMAAFYARPIKRPGQLLSRVGRLILESCGDFVVQYLFQDPEQSDGNTRVRKCTLSELLSGSRALPARHGFGVTGYDLRSRAQTWRTMLWILRYEHTDQPGQADADDPRVYFACPLKLFGRRKSERHRLSRKFFEAICASPDCYQGLIDVATFYESAYGMYYDDIWMHPMQWHRYVNRTAWEDAGPRRQELACAVHWGMLLGPGICAKLGDLKTFVAEFEAYLRRGIYHRQKASFDKHGRLQLLLSDDPMDMAEVDGRDAMGWTVDIGAWLQARLRDAGAVL